MMSNGLAVPPVVSLILAVAGVLTLLALWLLDLNSVAAVTAEDNVIEYAGALFFLLGFLICLYRIVVAGQYNQPLLYLWLFSSFLFLGEEVSWFQRVFDYSVPSVERVSTQREFNLHNLEVLERPSLGDGTPLEGLLHGQNLYRLGYFLYFLVLPVAVSLGFFKRLAGSLHYRVPDLYFLTAIWVTIALSVLLKPWYDPIGLERSLAETRESLSALFIAVYIYAYLRFPRVAASKSRTRAATTLE